MRLFFVLLLVCVEQCFLGTADIYAHIDVTPAEALELIESHADLIVVDVREEHEFCDEDGHIPCAVNYPLNSGVFEKQYTELPRDADILIVCRSGGRSNRAADFLDSRGYLHVYDMQGGMSSWEGETVACIDADGNGIYDDRDNCSRLSSSDNSTADDIPDNGTEPCVIELLYEEGAEELQVLREYRDAVLCATGPGQAVIKRYYGVNRLLKVAVEKDKSLKCIIRRLADIFLGCIR